MLQRLEKLICLVRSVSISCDIFDLHICQDRWKLENWCLLLTQVDCPFCCISCNTYAEFSKTPQLFQLLMDARGVKIIWTPLFLVHFIVHTLYIVIHSSTRPVAEAELNMIVRQARVLIIINNSVLQHIINTTLT